MRPTTARWGKKGSAPASDVGESLRTTDKCLSASKLEEVRSVARSNPNIHEVVFNTCSYQQELPPGQQALKAQRFSGTLARTCTCPPGAQREMMGKEVSARSVANPELAKMILNQLAKTEDQVIGGEEQINSAKDKEWIPQEASKVDAQFGWVGRGKFGMLNNLIKAGKERTADPRVGGIGTWLRSRIKAARERVRRVLVERRDVWTLTRPSRPMACSPVKEELTVDNERASA